MERGAIFISNSAMTGSNLRGAFVCVCVRARALARVF